MYEVIEKLFHNLTDKEIEKIHQEIKELNAFTRNKEKLPEKEKYLLIKGNNNILISAAHCVRHYRGKWKSQDVNVHLVALHLAKRGCYALIPLTLIKDPNYWVSPRGRNTDFAQAIIDICSKYGCKFFIDLHGKQGDDESVALGGDFYTPNEKIREFSQVLEELLRNNNIRIIRERIYSGGDLSRYVKEKYRIPSLQLEMSKFLRKEENLHKIIGILSQFVEYVNTRLDEIKKKHHLKDKFEERK